MHKACGYKAAPELIGSSMDCDDANSVLNPDTLWYQDNDGDGFGNSAISIQQCTQPGGPINYVLDHTDYNDNDPNIYPGGPTVRGRLNDGSFAYYTSIQEAYYAQGDEFGMDVQAVSFNEPIYLDRPITLIIRGGRNATFTSFSGSTILNGNVNVSNGTVYIGDFILQ